MSQLNEAAIIAAEVAQLPALRERLAEREAAGDQVWARDLAAIIAGIERRAAQPFPPLPRGLLRETRDERIVRLARERTAGRRPQAVAGDTRTRWI